MNCRLCTVLTVLLFGTLACQPVFAIGWEEILLFMILAAIALGPPLYRFLRKLENSRRQKDK
jgi:hypothetical protein